MEYDLHSPLCQFALKVAGEELFRLALAFKESIHVSKSEPAYP